MIGRLPTRQYWKESGRQLREKGASRANALKIALSLLAFLAVFLFLAFSALLPFLP